MRLNETRQVDRRPSEVFAFTADFANAAKWDPGVVSSRQVGGDAPGLGARYDLIVRFRSREIPMTYEITEWAPGSRVVLEGRGSAVVAVDVIEFEAHDGGTRVDYAADLQFTNWLRFLAPLLTPVMHRIGERALDGLVDALER